MRIVDVLDPTTHQEPIIAVRTPEQQAKYASAVDRTVQSPIPVIPVAVKLTALGFSFDFEEMTAWMARSHDGVDQ